MRRPEIDWTPAMIARLTTLWDAGLSTAAIGREMDITKNAVVGKAHRLNLRKRPSPIIKGGVPRPKQPPVPRTKGPTLMPLVALMQAPVAAPRVSPQPTATLATIMATLHARTAAIRPGGKCMFPLWTDQQRPTHKYCGAVTWVREDGARSNYCAHHHSVCHVRSLYGAALEAARANAAKARDASPVQVRVSKYLAAIASVAPAE